MASKKPATVTEAIRQRTAELAYAIWESEGRPHGRDQEHWQMAEAELMGAAQAIEAEAAGATEAISKPAARPKPAVQAEAQL